MSAPLVFDRHLLRRRRRRAYALGPSTFLLERVAEEVADRLAVILRRFDIVVDLGTPGDLLRRALANSPRIGTLIALDHSLDALASSRTLAVVADEEALPLKTAAIDLVVSGLSLQAVNDLPGAFAQIRRALTPDGLFLAALLGGDTLTELRQSFSEAESEMEGGASPRVAPFADVREIGALLQRAGFALPVADVDRVTVRYASPFALMQDLRRMGASNSLIERRRSPLRRVTLLRMAQIYSECFGDPDGRVRATFDIVWLSGWSPHDSQQKPLRPGSAQARLSEALGVQEISAGEKARPK
jgi:SAM-dependent methyltransferase